MNGVVEIEKEFEKYRLGIKKTLSNEYVKISKDMDQISDIVNSLIKEIEHHSKQQKTTYANMKKMFDNINSIVILQNIKNGGAVYKNKAILKIFRDGLSKEKKRFQLLLIELLDIGSGHSRKKQYHDMVNKNWYSVDTVNLVWDDGEMVYLHTLTNITNMKQIEEQLIKEANIDRMTGVYNRSGGRYVFAKFINTLANGESACMCMIDLDGLKLINDQYGHCAGDEAITSLAEAIKSGINSDDIVSRIGGDEFVVILKKPIEYGKVVMENIQNKVEDYNDISQKPYRIEFSYGLCEITNEDRRFDEISNRADSIMYFNKNRKKEKLS